MYPFVLATHSILRWVVFALLLLVPLRALGRAVRGEAIDATGARLSLGLLISTDLQLLMGLLLLVTSPLTQTAFGNMAVAMKDRTLRFYAVEHEVTMLVAIVLVHVARVLSKRAANDGDAQRRLATWTLVALLVVLVGMPWPFLAHGRPLFPHL